MLDVVDESNSEVSPKKYKKLFVSDKKYCCWKLIINISFRIRKQLANFFIHI